MLFTRSKSTQYAHIITYTCSFFWHTVYNPNFFDHHYIKTDQVSDTQIISIDLKERQYVEIHTMFKIKRLVQRYQTISVDCSNQS